jgi:hypothetical protein
MNVTVPVGAVPLEVSLTLAVKVTDWASVEGFSDEVTAVDVEFGLTVRLPAKEAELAA